MHRNDWQYVTIRGFHQAGNKNRIHLHHQIASEMEGEETRGEEEERMDEEDGLTEREAVIGRM